MTLSLFHPIVTISALFMTPLTLSLQADMGTVLACVSQIETGDKDWKIGRAGEVSRYQILPSVWIKYSPTNHVKQNDPTNPKIAAQVAERILVDRITKFRGLKGRAPTPFEVYGLWHRPEETYKGRYKPATRTRCQRFENLYFDLIATKTKPSN